MRVPEAKGTGTRSRCGTGAVGKATGAGLGGAGGQEGEGALVGVWVARCGPRAYRVGTCTSASEHPLPSSMEKGNSFSEAL